MRRHVNVPAQAAGAGTPIACSLTQTAAQAQLQEWRSILAASVAAIDQVSRTELSLRLRDLSHLEALARLAQREKTCCPFFGFTICIEADGLALRISVPEDAASLLDQFARLVGATTPR